MRKLALSTPIACGCVTISSVTLRTPTEGDARAIAAIATHRGDGSFAGGLAAGVGTVARLSGLPPRLIKKLAVRDLRALMNACVDLMAERHGR